MPCSFMAQRFIAAGRTLRLFLVPWYRLTQAQRHYRHFWLMQCFWEWRLLGQLKLLLFQKVQDIDCIILCLSG